MRIEMLLEVSLGIRLGDDEQAVIEPHLRIKRVGSADPMDGALHLSARCGAAGLAVEIGGASKFGNVATRVLHNFFALDDEGIFEPHFAARTQPKIFWRR